MSKSVHSSLHYATSGESDNPGKDVEKVANVTKSDNNI